MLTSDHKTHRHSAVYRKLLHLSRTLHTYFSMLAVILFLFFGVTGFMLNHAEWFGLDNAHKSETKISIPEKVIKSADKLTLVEFLRSEAKVSGAVQQFDWPGEGEPFHVAFKSPKSQVDVDISLADKEATISTETHGLSGLLSRLHTARDAGRAWQLLLDATSILLIFASLTGIILWQSLPKRRVLGIISLAISIAAIAVVYFKAVP